MLQPDLCREQNGRGKKQHNQPGRWPGNPATPTGKMREPPDNVQSSAVSQVSGAARSFPAAGRINPHAKVRKPSGTTTPVSPTQQRASARAPTCKPATTST